MKIINFAPGKSQGFRRPPIYSVDGYQFQFVYQCVVTEH
jgi:hypothetical protein